MADTQEDPKSLEMRVAAIEDKLSKMSVTEQDLQSYQKVASLLGVTTARQPCVAQIGTGTIRPINIPISIPVHIPTPIIINDCIQAGVGGAASSTGFGSLGQ
jgi:hypothetical protein